MIWWYSTFSNSNKLGTSSSVHQEGFRIPSHQNAWSLSLNLIKAYLVVGRWNVKWKVRKVKKYFIFLVSIFLASCWFWRNWRNSKLTWQYMVAVLKIDKVGESINYYNKQCIILLNWQKTACTLDLKITLSFHLFNIW